MTIQRLYQPDPEASERVVEILYRLLVEPPQDCSDEANAEQSETEESTCVSTECEG
jgi:hypothetical protein